jgi:cobalamin biosynthesis protein CobD/CbiB
MERYQTIGAQVLGGIFIALWLLSRPLVWLYSLLKWFVVSVFKETGNRLVKYTGGAIALLIFVYITQHLLQ